MSHLKQLAKTVSKNKAVFTLSSFLDLAFFSAFVFTYAAIMLPVFNILNKFSTMFQSVGLTDDYTQSAQALTSLAANPDFLSSFSDLMSLLKLLIASIFLIWVVFQGVNYYLASRILLKKTKFWEYFGKFSIFSLFFYVLVLLTFALAIYLMVLDSTIPVPLFSQLLINVIVIASLLFISYFGFVSLYMIRARKIIPAFLDTFRLGARKFLWIVLLFICLAAIFIALLAIISILMGINIIILYLGCVLIFAPIISLLRIAFIYYMDMITAKI